ncbi:MAG TPA: hypothetical protein VGP73_04935 [Thermoanaerobaculia bacterium]
MATLAMLQEQKNKVREKIVAQDAPGVIGVAIDPNKLKLIVFAIRSQPARDFLSRLLGPGALDDIDVISGRVLAEGNSLSLEERIKSRALIKVTAQDPIELFPGSQVQPSDGSLGCVGCFVLLKSGEPVALTVRHVFHDKVGRQLVNFCDDLGCVPCGTSAVLGDLVSGPVNYSECALFDFLANVLPKSNGSLSGGFVGGADVKKVEKESVVSLASLKTATVLDSDAMITYPVFLGRRDANGDLVEDEVLFDRQILLEGSFFGQPGDSGAAVVMEKGASDGTFKKGDILGLHSASMVSSDYHFATPLFACLKLLSAYLKEEKIFLP